MEDIISQRPQDIPSFTVKWMLNRHGPCDPRLADRAEIAADPTRNAGISLGIPSFQENIILLTDSYKVSHANLYPPGTTKVYSYFESRGGQFEETLFFGLQYILKRYLQGVVVTETRIQEAATFFEHHMEGSVFNRAHWEYILTHHEGRLPILIKAVPEGQVMPTRNLLFSIENTDPQCYWLPNYLESLLVQVWYPITVATLSREFRKVFEQYENLTSDNPVVDWKLHDFGFRGVSSLESAALGGMGHLLSFEGSDNLAGVLALKEYYMADNRGRSIPASEHSTICAWGPDGEREAMAHLLQEYPTGTLACVSDSYNIYECCRQIWGTALKDEILGRQGVLLIRPDSGEPTEVLPQVLEILETNFGTTLNTKGFKVLPSCVRLVQGDGISLATIGGILQAIMEAGFATENVSFGAGGGLLQQVHRDTLSFALKCAEVQVNDETRPVFKAPVHASQKASRRGRQLLVKSDEGWQTLPAAAHLEETDHLVAVFENGSLLVDQSLDQIMAVLAETPINYCGPLEVDAEPTESPAPSV